MNGLEKTRFSIYMIKNNKTNKYYIGQDSYTPYRKNQHFSDLRKGKHHSIKLQRSFDLHGESCFVHDIIEYLDCHSKLVEREQYWMNFYNSLHDGYNMIPADTSNYKIKRGPQSEEQKRNTSKSLKGRKFSQEHKKNISLANKGKIIKEETRIKLSKAHLGRKRNPNLGPIVRTEEYKLKLSKALTGKVKTKQHQENINKAIKGLKKSPEHLEKTVAALQKHNEKRREITMNKKIFYYFVLCLLLAGCAQKNNACGWVDYIYVSQKDTRDTKLQVLAHNLKVKSVCNR